MRKKKIDLRIGTYTGPLDHLKGCVALIDVFNEYKTIAQFVKRGSYLREPADPYSDIDMSYGWHPFRSGDFKAWW